MDEIKIEKFKEWLSNEFMKMEVPFDTMDRISIGFDDEDACLKVHKLLQKMKIDHYIKYSYGQFYKEYLGSVSIKFNLYGFNTEKRMLRLCGALNELDISIIKRIEVRIAAFIDPNGYYVESIFKTFV